MMTDKELVDALRLRYQNISGPDTTHDGRVYFRVDGMPMMLEQVRELVGDVERQDPG